MNTVIRAAAWALLIGSTFSAQDPSPKLWLPIWPDKIVRFDPVSDQIDGEIKLSNGLFFGVDLSHDKQRFIAITGQRTIVEVVDRKSMQVVEEHPFQKTGYIIRVGEVKETPDPAHWFVRVERVKAELDHYVIEDEEWWYYNRVDKKVELVGDRLPREIRSGARLSPDGKNWHVFGKDIVVLDGATRKEIGKVDLSTPRFTGAGAIRLRGSDWNEYDDPKSYRMLYSSTDPVRKNRSVVGIAEIDLERLEVRSLSEWGVDPGYLGWGLRVSHDKRFAYATQGLGGGGGRGGGGGGRSASAEDPETKILRIDLATGKAVGEKLIKMRPRARLHAVSPDGSKFYIGGAGNDFQVYDADFNYLKTVVFPGDLSGGLWVLAD